MPYRLVRDARYPKYARDYSKVVFMTKYLITATDNQVTVIDVDQSSEQIDIETMRLDAPLASGWTFNRSSLAK